MSSPTNEGARLLRRELQGHGAQSKFCCDHGFEPGLVSRWVRGERLPSTPNRVRLQELLGIAWTAWDEPVKADETGSAA